MLITLTPLTGMAPGEQEQLTPRRKGPSLRSPRRRGERHHAGKGRRAVTETNEKLVVFNGSRRQRL
jgi:hypothetical protein